MQKPQLLIIGILIFMVSISACRKEPSVIPPVTTQVMPAGGYGPGSDFYLLNEGNMGSNKASLDYFDHNAGTYANNIYGAVNPAATLGLGDVGNDIKVYGGKLYVVVNGSGKVEILDKYTAIRLGQIDIENCRQVAFWGGKIYISSYKGYVGVVDTSHIVYSGGSTQLDKKIPVGREPEGMVVVADSLYVANSGGYSPPLFDNTISVIDLRTAAQVRKIKVGVNLDQLEKDDYGHIWVSSRGDYLKVPPSFYVLDVHQGKVIQHLDIPVGNFAIKGELLYYFTATYAFGGETTADKVHYGLVDVKKMVLQAGSYIAEDVQQKISHPFALAPDPLSDRLLLTDGGDNVSPGTLYWLDKSGNISWKVMTGDIPGHIVFM